MQTLFEHWPLVFGLIGFLALVLVLRRISLWYGHRISAQLEKFIVGPVPVASPPTAISQPISSENGVVVIARQGIWKELQAVPSESAVGCLVHQLAEVRVENEFWKTYHQIYHSQVELLRALCKTGGAAKREDVEEFFRVQFARGDSARESRFEPWVGFLVSRGALSVAVSSFEVTLIGREFLVWIIRNQLPDRPHDT